MSRLFSCQRKLIGTNIDYQLEAEHFIVYEEYLTRKPSIYNVIPEPECITRFFFLTPRPKDTRFRQRGSRSKCSGNELLGPEN
jgi:hypothetical protein